MANANRSLAAAGLALGRPQCEGSINSGASDAWDGRYMSLTDIADGIETIPKLGPPNIGGELGSGGQDKCPDTNPGENVRMTLITILDCLVAADH